MFGIVPKFRRQGRVRGQYGWCYELTYPGYMNARWTCDRLDECRWFVFAHGWALLGACARDGVPTAGLIQIRDTEAYP